MLIPVLLQWSPSIEWSQPWTSVPSTCSSWSSRGTSSRERSRPRCATSSRTGRCGSWTCSSSTRTPNGEVGSVELAGLGPDLEPAFADLDGQLGGGLLDAEDVAQVGADLKPNSSAALIVWENTWAARFVTAMRNAGAHVVDQARIPAEAVAAALDAAAAEGS